MSLEKQTRPVYEFGPFRLDAAERLLLRDGEPVTRVRLKEKKAGVLTPKVVETLLALVERGGQIVSKDELMRSVWPDTVVEESNLASNIYLLRRALGAMDDGRPYIETFPKRGYRFNGPLRDAGAEISTRFEDSDGGRAGAQATADAQAAADVPELIIRRRTRTHILEDVEETAEAEAAGDETTSAEVTSAEVKALPKPDARRRRRLVVASALAVAALSAASFVAWRLYVGAGEPFARTRLTRVTNSGTTTHAAVSPDGQYVVHVAGGAGQQSLQLRHVATGSDTEIVPPGRGLTRRSSSRATAATSTTSGSAKRAGSTACLCWAAPRSCWLRTSSAGSRFRPTAKASPSCGAGRPKWKRSWSSPTFRGEASARSSRTMVSGECFQPFRWRRGGRRGRPTETPSPSGSERPGTAAETTGA